MIETVQTEENQPTEKLNQDLGSEGESDIVSCLKTNVCIFSLFFFFSSEKVIFVEFLGVGFLFVEPVFCVNGILACNCRMV